MEIRNITRKSSLATNVELAKSLWKKSLGLMFRTNLKDDFGLLMEFERPSKDIYSIWMLGMFVPIDIIFISERKQVTDVFHDVKPLSFNPSTWKVYRPSMPVKWILELKAGKARKARTVPGDRISISE